MDKSQSLVVLIDVAKLAQSKGLFSLEDAVVVHQAVLAAEAEVKAEAQAQEEAKAKLEEGPKQLLEEIK